MENNNFNQLFSHEKEIINLLGNLCEKDSSQQLIKKNRVLALTFCDLCLYFNIVGFENWLKCLIKEDILKNERKDIYFFRESNILIEIIIKVLKFYLFKKIELLCKFSKKIIGREKIIIKCFEDSPLIVYNIIQYIFKEAQSKNMDEYLGYQVLITILLHRFFLAIICNDFRSKSGFFNGLYRFNLDFSTKIKSKYMVYENINEFKLIMKENFIINLLNCFGIGGSFNEIPYLIEKTKKDFKKSKYKNKYKLNISSIEKNFLIQKFVNIYYNEKDFENSKNIINQYPKLSEFIKDDFNTKTLKKTSSFYQLESFNNKSKNVGVKRSESN